MSGKKDCLLGKIPEAELHWKIIGLVNDRIKPVQQDFNFEKGCCKTCISKCEPEHKAVKKEQKEIGQVKLPFKKEKEMSASRSIKGK